MQLALAMWLHFGQWDMSRRLWVFPLKEICGWSPSPFIPSPLLGDNGNQISFLGPRGKLYVEKGMYFLPLLDCLMKEKQIMWFKPHIHVVYMWLSLCYNNSTYTINTPFVMKPIGDFEAAAQRESCRKVRSAVGLTEAHIYTYCFGDCLFYICVFSFLLQTEKKIIIYKW